jgi:hypothetical protein
MEKLAKQLCAEECKKIAIEFNQWIILHYPNQYKSINPQEKGFYTIEELFNKFLEQYKS